MSNLIRKEGRFGPPLGKKDEHIEGLYAVRSACQALHYALQRALENPTKERFVVVGRKAEQCYEAAKMAVMIADRLPAEKW